MHEIFRIQKDSIGGSMKQGSIKRLNDYVNPILLDQDPEQGIEEEYKRKQD